MGEVTEDMNERWAGTGVTAHFMIESYTPGWEDTIGFGKSMVAFRAGYTAEAIRRAISETK
jgi:hypothetical protein